MHWFNETENYRSIPNSLDIAIDVWGDRAMFTKPYTPVERSTYIAPTPSACRGFLNAIMQKPLQFYYLITSIEVMNPIKLDTEITNEVKSVGKQDVTLTRTQRNNTFLRDVYYRIHAKIVKRDDARKIGSTDEVHLEALYDQFYRKVVSGRKRYQPYFGVSDYLGYFSLPDKAKKPINESMDLGIMLYDRHDPTSNVINSSKISFYHAYMKNGVITVPIWGDEEIKTL